MDEPVDWVVSRVSGPLSRRAESADGDDWTYSAVLKNSKGALHEIWFAVPSDTVRRLLKIEGEDELAEAAACKQLVSAFCYDLLQYEWAVESSFDLKISRKNCIRLLKR